MAHDEARFQGSVVIDEATICLYEDLAVMRLELHEALKAKSMVTSHG